MDNIESSFVLRNLYWKFRYWICASIVLTTHWPTPDVGQNEQLMHITHVHRVGPIVVNDVAIEVEERLKFNILSSVYFTHFITHLIKQLK